MNKTKSKEQSEEQSGGAVPIGSEASGVAGTSPPSQPPASSKQRKKRTPKDPAKLTSGDILLKESREWTAECIRLRPALDAIERASRRGLEVLRDAIQLRDENPTEQPTHAEK